MIQHILAVRSLVPLPFLNPAFRFSSVQSLSRVWLFETPGITACQAPLSINNSWSSLRFTSIESMKPSSHLILCRPLLLLPPIPPSIRVFSNESTLCMRWPKYWSFSFSIIPSKEIPGLIFKMDWLHLLAVQGTLKSLLQHHSSKASILQSCGHCWVFQIFCHIDHSTFTASSLRIWNSSAGMPSPPLALFVVRLPKVHMISHSRMSGSS